MSDAKTKHVGIWVGTDRLKRTPRALCGTGEPSPWLCEVFADATCGKCLRLAEDAPAMLKLIQAAHLVIDGIRPQARLVAELRAMLEKYGVAI